MTGVSQVLLGCYQWGEVNRTTGPYSFQPLLFRPPMDAGWPLLSVTTRPRDDAIEERLAPCHTAGRPFHRLAQSPFTTYGARCAALLHLQNNVWVWGIRGPVGASC